MPVTNGKRPREDSGVPVDEAATRDTARCALEAKDAAATPLDRVVVLNVGGTKITTLHSTLCSSPSLLAQWAEDNFQEFPRDLQGHPFLDRDPENFVHILNYLRGYGLPNKADDLVVVAKNAKLYQLESLKPEIGLQPQSKWRLTPARESRRWLGFSPSNSLTVVQKPFYRACPTIVFPLKMRTGFPGSLP
ncbi:conserved hypothetical protein [Leishmania braziliensis MHOM/BR/75/M2904]|uniref:BTB domain-containing protein n=1 Tax=Leishmania braziliensis TaxID=5660 RepID=A4HGB0_LEIBR|nr:conserved hypothetical protein [Leishmania braziliensis MHOM/BR/75/M2904]CAM39602.2 conserved hypothetical protein [Leishmania braziliensis MHOM/BR/75/M2904]